MLGNSLCFPTTILSFCFSENTSFSSVSYILWVLDSY
jgi:hypothetical protein